MTENPSPFHDAVAERDVNQLRSLLSSGEFILLSTTKSEQEDDGNVGAVTAEVGDMEVLVVFTSEETAGQFVHDSGDLFDEDEEVDGVVVEGGALLEYLPEGFGILLDPEGDEALIIEPGIIAELRQSDS